MFLFWLNGVVLKKINQGTHGPTAMAHGIFLFGCTLRERMIPAIRTEKRVVAESAVSGRSFKYASVNLAIEEMSVFANHECDCRTETCRPGLRPRKFFKQHGIVSRIVVRTSAEAGAIYAWSTAEGIHLKSGIIGETIVAILFLHPHCLGKGIAFKGRGILRNIVMASDVGKRQDFHPVAKDSADFR